MKLVLVKACEWEGLYKDGELVDQNHSLSSSEIVQAFGGKVVRLSSAGEDILMEEGRLPMKLKHVKVKK